MEKLFEKILDNDEKIEKVIKPHKGKYFFSVMLSWGLSLAIFAVMGIIFILIPEEGMEKTVRPYTSGERFRNSR